MNIKMSIVPYNDGKIEIIIIDDTGRQLSVYCEHELTEEQQELIDYVAPPCVWTEYVKK